MRQRFALIVLVALAVLSPVRAAGAGSAPPGAVRVPSALILTYSTFFGRAGTDSGVTVKTDDAGNIYLAGTTDSPDFPVRNPIQPYFGGGLWDCFLTKFDRSGSQIIYSTFLGGAGEEGCDIAVGGDGNVYLAGFTNSLNFPLVNPIQPVYGGGITDGIIAHISRDGSSLLYSTYFGGSGTDAVNGIGIDALDNVYLGGWTGSTDFPLVAPIQPLMGGMIDSFVAKLNPAGSALLYSTYLGGDQNDQGQALTIDKQGNVYLTGLTGSTDFPLVAPLQAAFGGGQSDGFVTHVNTAGTAWSYSTYLGGSGDEWFAAITHDLAGDVFLTGYTGSTDFPLANPVQPVYAGGLYDAVIAQLNPSGSALRYSTYLGGSDEDRGYGIGVSPSGRVYVSGYTYSIDFPLRHAVQAYYAGGVCDGFVTSLTADGADLSYSTYLGGSYTDVSFSLALSPADEALVTGWTVSEDFPVRNALQPAYGGGDNDAFISKLIEPPPAFYFPVLLYGWP